MALTFAASSGQRVEVADAASIRTLGVFTALQWVFVNGNVGNAAMWRKGTGAQGMAIINSGTGGDIRCKVFCTVDPNLITNNTPLATTGKWYLIAYQWNGIGNNNHIYVGTLTTEAAECTYGTNTNATGTQTSDSGQTLAIGNNVAGAGSGSFNGAIAVAALYNRALTLGEIITFQFERRPMQGCVLYHELGFNGVGTQIDWSGNGNSGTVTGATQTAHVPTMQPFYNNNVIPQDAATPVGGSVFTRYYYDSQVAGLNV